MSEVSTGLVPFTTVPAGKHLKKVTLYSDGAGVWRNDTTPMVTTENGSTIFQFDEDAVIVAAHLESSTPVTGAVSLNVSVGPTAIFASAPIASVNSVGVGAQVCSHGPYIVLGSTGLVTVVNANKLDDVLLTSNTPSTAGDVFVCIYYYV